MLGMVGELIKQSQCSINITLMENKNTVLYAFAVVNKAGSVTRIFS